MFEILCICAQGLKFKADLHSKMSVCRPELGEGIQPPTPDNSVSFRFAETRFAEIMVRGLVSSRFAETRFAEIRV